MELVSCFVIPEMCDADIIDALLRLAPLSSNHISLSPSLVTSKPTSLRVGKQNKQPNKTQNSHPHLNYFTFKTN